MDLERYCLTYLLLLECIIQVFDKFDLVDDEKFSVVIREVLENKK